MARFSINRIIQIDELGIELEFNITSNIYLFSKTFNGNNIYFLVVNDYSIKGEHGSTILHTDLNDLKKWANNNKTLFDLAIETKALFYLYVKNEKEVIKRIQHTDIGPSKIWNIYERINKDDFKQYLRNKSIDDILK
jgi:hypothetical protein